MKKLFFLSFFSFFIGCGSSSVPPKQTVAEPQPIIEKEQTNPEEAPPDLKTSAYNLGYKTGHQSFMRQMGLNSNDESYTSNKESEIDESILDTEEYQEIRMKGYVDGYHKAGESIMLQENNCPRKY